MTTGVLTLILPVLLLAASAGQAAAASSSLSVSIDDGVTSAASADRLDYFATVVNDGAEPFARTVVLEAPDFVELEADDGDVAGGTVTWEVEVAAGASAEFTPTGRVGEIADWIRTKCPVPRLRRRCRGLASPTRLRRRRG